MVCNTNSQESRESLMSELHLNPDPTERYQRLGTKPLQKLKIDPSYVPLAERMDGSQSLSIISQRLCCYPWIIVDLPLYSAPRDSTVKRPASNKLDDHGPNTWLCKCSFGAKINLLCQLTFMILRSSVMLDMLDFHRIQIVSEQKKCLWLLD